MLEIRLSSHALKRRGFSRLIINSLMKYSELFETDIPAYHGTGQDIVAFAEKEFGKPTSHYLDFGIHFSLKPHTANLYATASEHDPKHRKGLSSGMKQGNPVVYPVLIDPGNMLDLTEFHQKPMEWLFDQSTPRGRILDWAVRFFEKNSSKTTVKKYRDMLGYDPEKAFTVIQRRLGNKTIQKAFIRYGIDSVKYSWDGENILVFDPKRNFILFGSKKINEVEDRFTGSTFADDDGNEYSVEKAYNLAKTICKPISLPISKIEHDLKWWDEGLENGSQSEDHMKTVDTSYPILVFRNPDGHLTVPDGLNRMKKARDIEGKTHIKAYVIDWNDEAKKQTIKESVLKLSKEEIENEIQALRLSLEAKFSGLNLWCSLTFNGALVLNQIEFPKSNRNQGAGTQVMRTLIQFADKHKLTMVLTPDKSYGGSVSRLKEFYKRFGFSSNTGRRKDYRYSETMIRRPNIKESILNELEIGGGVSDNILDDLKKNDPEDYEPKQLDLFSDIPTLEPHFTASSGFKGVGRIEKYTVTQMMKPEKHGYGADGVAYVLFDRGKAIGVIALSDIHSETGDTKHPNYNLRLSNHKGYRVSTIFTHKEYRGQNLSLKLYKFLLTNVCDFLMADTLQTWGGVAVWKKMLNSRQFAVLVFDDERHVLRKRRSGKDFGQVYNTNHLFPLVTLPSKQEMLYDDWRES